MAFTELSYLTHTLYTNPANQTVAEASSTPVTVYIVPAIGFMLLILAVTIGVIAILFRLHTFRRTHVYEDILAAGKGKE